MKLTSDKPDPDWWNQINWFAVQAKPYRENLAAANVGNLDAEVFLPKAKQEQAVCGTPRIVVKPLFAGYFFARFSALISLDVVRHARGVLRVVGTGTFPLPVSSGIISEIRARVQDDGFVRLESRAFSPGEKVTIERGPFGGLIGKVERESNDGKRVAILLEAINQARVLVEKRWLTQAAEV